MSTVKYGLFCFDLNVSTHCSLVNAYGAKDLSHLSWSNLQASNWTNIDLLLTVVSGQLFNEILFKIQTFFLIQENAVNIAISKLEVILLINKQLGNVF